MTVKTKCGYHLEQMTDQTKYGYPRGQMTMCGEFRGRYLHGQKTPKRSYLGGQLTAQMSLPRGQKTIQLQLSMYHITVHVWLHLGTVAWPQTMVGHLRKQVNHKCACVVTFGDMQSANVAEHFRDS